MRNALESTARKRPITFFAALFCALLVGYSTLYISGYVFFMPFGMKSLLGAGFYSELIIDFLTTASASAVFGRIIALLVLVALKSTTILLRRLKFQGGVRLRVLRTYRSYKKSLLPFTVIFALTSFISFHIEGNNLTLDLLFSGFAIFLLVFLLVAVGVQFFGRPVFDREQLRLFDQDRVMIAIISGVTVVGGLSSIGAGAIKFTSAHVTESTLTLSGGEEVSITLVGTGPSGVVVIDWSERHDNPQLDYVFLPFGSFEKISQTVR